MGSRKGKREGGEGKWEGKTPNIWDTFTLNDGYYYLVDSSVVFILNTAVSYATLYSIIARLCVINYNLAPYLRVLTYICGTVCTSSGTVFPS